MQQLMPLAAKPVGIDVIQTVDGRALHAFLEVQTRFNDWIRRRIEEYGFVQEIDFTCYSDLSNGNPTPAIAYALSLDMAKELSMVERTEKGKQARQYFLACEKALQQQTAHGVTRSSHPNTPIAPLVQQELLERRYDFLERTGMLAEPDKLLFADAIRTAMLRESGKLLPAGPSDAAPQWLDVADCVAELGYLLTRKQSAVFLSQLGRRFAAEHRSRLGTEPHQTQRYIDGKLRPVNLYPRKDLDWIAPMIQAFFAGFPGIARQCEEA